MMPAFPRTEQGGPSPTHADPMLQIHAVNITEAARIQEQLAKATAAAASAKAAASPGPAPVPGYQLLSGKDVSG